MILVVVGRRDYRVEVRVGQGEIVRCEHAESIARTKSGPLPETESEPTPAIAVASGAIVAVRPGGHHVDTTIDELAGIASSGARTSVLIQSSDLATPVTHLGRWKVRDVAAHLGGVHRWATRIVTTRSMDGPGFTKSKLDGIELCDWFDSGLEELLAAFRTNNPDDPCPNFNPGSVKTVRWWLRRQLHETMVHRWDIERALGCTTPVDPAVAADGIDEFLDVFVRTRGKQMLTAPLILSSTQPSRSWTLTPAARPGRLDIAAGRSGDATTELSGEPEQLLLALWRRLTISEAGLAVSGDPALAGSLFGHP